MKLSVIIPVHNGGNDFRYCLEALQKSIRAPDEIVVVDDASIDSSGDLARTFGAQVLTLGDLPSGPAFARNRGAEFAQGDILIFIDADVVVHDDTLLILEKYINQNSEIAAFFGSYDDAPPKNGLVSRYKNLQHHFIHQNGQRETSTFWAGCGAIRRDIFLVLGGFSEDYTRSSVEDIEFGLRLKRAGYRVWLCADVQVTHLKRWKLYSLLRSDIFDRAMPWAHLIFSTSYLPSVLNLDLKSRVSALAAWAFVASLALGFHFTLARFCALLSITLLLALNMKLYRFFLERGDLVFAIGATGLHMFYYLYSSLAFATVLGWQIFQTINQRLRNFVFHHILAGVPQHEQ